MLTPNMRRIIDAIDAIVAEGSARPTIRAISERTGMNSTSSVLRILRMLEARGFISRDPRTRSVSIIHRGEATASGEPLSDDPVVAYIHRHQSENRGQTPTFRQIVAGAGLSSLSSAYRSIHRLADQGFLILGEKTHSRTIQVVKKKEDIHGD